MRLEHGELGRSLHPNHQFCPKCCKHEDDLDHSMAVHQHRCCLGIVSQPCQICGVDVHRSVMAEHNEIFHRQPPHVNR